MYTGHGGAITGRGKFTQHLSFGNPGNPTSESSFAIRAGFTLAISHASHLCCVITAHRGVLLAAKERPRSQGRGLFQFHLRMSVALPIAASEDGPSRGIRIARLSQTFNFDRAEVVPKRVRLEMPQLCAFTFTVQSGLWAELGPNVSPAVLVSLLGESEIALR